MLNLPSAQNSGCWISALLTESNAQYLSVSLIITWKQKLMWPSDRKNLLPKKNDAIISVMSYKVCINNIYHYNIFINRNIQNLTNARWDGWLVCRGDVKHRHGLQHFKENSLWQAKSVMDWAVRDKRMDRLLEVGSASLEKESWLLSLIPKSSNTDIKRNWNISPQCKRKSHWSLSMASTLYQAQHCVNYL